MAVARNQPLSVAKLRLGDKEKEIRGQAEAARGEDRPAGAEEMPVSYTASRRLHELRRRLGLTQRQMARQFGVATSTVTAWEAGLYTRPLRLAYRLLKLEGAPRFWHVFDERGVPQGSGFDAVRERAEPAAKRFMREIRKQPLRLV